MKPILKKVYEVASAVYFLIATLLLVVAAFVLLATAVYDLVVTFPSPDMTGAALDAVGLLIIGFAVVETAKFIAEEELLRDRELRSSLESRRSITKFTTIIVIAMSLEALVMVFKTTSEDITKALYPALLFVAAMSALVALGVYQYLSSRIVAPTEGQKQEHEDVTAEMKEATE